MPFGLKDKDVECIINVLKQNTKIDEAIIFGSRAMGTERLGSDIDIALKGNGINQTDINKLNIKLDNQPIAYDFDFVIYQQIKTPELIKHIDENGITFYTKEKLPSEWKTYKLGDLVEINKNSINKNYSFDEIEYLDTSSVTENRFSELQKLNLSLAPSRAKRIVNKNDIVYSTVRPILRHYGIAKNINPNTVASTGFAVLTAKKIDPNFLYYYLTTDEIVYFLNSVAEANTTTYPAFNSSLLENIEVTIPDLPTQTQIAQILTSLDDKIELNLQMNQTLEAMAQALFKEWFVNFNFPNFDGELENGLPKGWKKCQVKDICEANASTLNSKDAINEVHYIEISEVDRGIIKNISIYKRGEEPSRAKRKLKHGDTVLSTVRPNRGSYFLSIFPNENLIASTGFAVFSPSTVPFSYLYIFLTNDDQLEFYGKMADGAAYPAINQSVIMNMEVILPTKELLEKYHDVSGNLLTRIFENLEANKILTQTRDTLLPKLMSGKLELV